MATELKDITLNINADGRISNESIGDMFGNALAGSSSLTRNQLTGFVAGVRCVERIMSAAGINPLMLLDGRLIVQKKPEAQQ